MRNTIVLAGCLAALLCGGQAVAAPKGGRQPLLQDANFPAQFTCDRIAVTVSTAEVTRDVVSGWNNFVTQELGRGESWLVVDATVYEQSGKDRPLPWRSLIKVENKGGQLLAPDRYIRRRTSPVPGDQEKLFANERDDLRILFLLRSDDFPVRLHYVQTLTVPGEKAVAGPNVNLLQNAGFENGENAPDAWAPDALIAGASFTWDAKQSHSGKRAACIEAKEANDARWVQTVSVLPNTDYVLSGWIKTQGAKHGTGQVNAVANLCVMGTWEHTAGLTGTNDWTFVKREFNSGDTTRILIGCRLGYWSGTAKGKVWFDDVSLKRKE